MEAAVLRVVVGVDKALAVAVDETSFVVVEVAADAAGVVDVVKVLFAVVVSAFGSAAAHCLHFEGRRNRCFETGARLLLG